MITALEQVFPLLKLLSSEFAAKDGPAAGVHSIGEVLAGDADALTLPVLQLPVIDVAPLLQLSDASSTTVLAPCHHSPVKEDQVRAELTQELEDLVFVCREFLKAFDHKQLAELEASIQNRTPQSGQLQTAARNSLPSPSVNAQGSC